MKFWFCHTRHIIKVSKVRCNQSKNFNIAGISEKWFRELGHVILKGEFMENSDMTRITPPKPK